MKIRRKTLDYLLIGLGTALMAFAIVSVYDPAGFVTGGFTGIAIIIKGMSERVLQSGIPLWFTNLILNIPLFITAIYMKGFSFIRKTFLATFLLSVWLYILPEVLLIEEDSLLTALLGGSLSGLGIGLVLAAGATTGGVDLMATLLHAKYRGYSIVHIMQVIDAAIVCFGAFWFGMNKALYAIVAIIIVTFVSDYILAGGKFAKAIYVISDKPEMIAAELMQKLERGVTGIEAQGMYSGKRRQVLFCVVSKKEIVTAKDIVSHLDPNAFIIVSEAREVFGEGFVKNA